VREEDRRLGLQVLRDLSLEDLGLYLVGHEERDDLRSLNRFGDRSDREPRRFGGGPGGAPRPEADLHLHARVPQVERVGVALASVAEDRDLAGEKIGVAFAVNGCHQVPFASGERAESWWNGLPTPAPGRFAPCGRAP
jgi:hypothetical protein